MNVISSFVFNICYLICQLFIFFPLVRFNCSSFYYSLTQKRYQLEIVFSRPTLLRYVDSPPLCVQNALSSFSIIFVFIMCSFNQNSGGSLYSTGFSQIDLSNNHFIKSIALNGGAFCAGLESHMYLLGGNTIDFNAAGNT